MRLDFIFEDIPPNIERDSPIAYFNLYEADNCSGEKLTSIPIVITEITTNTLEVSKDQRIKIYPNPGSDRFHIDIPQLAKPVLIELTDISGKQFFKREIPPANAKQKISIDASKFPRGVYFLSVSSENYILGEKVIKR